MLAVAFLNVLLSLILKPFRCSYCALAEDATASIKATAAQQENVFMAFVFMTFPLLLECRAADLSGLALGDEARAELVADLHREDRGAGTLYLETELRVVRGVGGEVQDSPAFDDDAALVGRNAQLGTLAFQRAVLRHELPL